MGGLTFFELTTEFENKLETPAEKWITGQKNDGYYEIFNIKFE